MTLFLVIVGSAMLVIGSACSIGAAYCSYNIDRFVLAYSGSRRHGKPTLHEAIQAVNPQLVGKMTPGIITNFWAGLFLTLFGNAVILVATILTFM